MSPLNLVVIVDYLELTQVRNDMYCFSGVSWRKIQQQGRVPAARESHLAVAYLDRWIFLYGGCVNSTILEDMFLFDTGSNTWSQFTRFMGRMPLRTDASICIMRDQIIVFGGRDRKKKYTNDMFRMRVEWQSERREGKTATIVIQQVEFANSPPPERSGHVSLAYNNRYLFILAGERDLSAGTHKKSNLDLLNDVWVFDFQTLLWLRIVPANQSLFTKRTNFSAVIFNNSIVIFGGIKQTENFTSHDDLLVMGIDSNSKIVRAANQAAKLCFSCLSRAECKIQQIKQSQNLVDTCPKIDLGMVYQLTKFIPHPFEAVCLIANYFASRGTSRIDINYETVNECPRIRICSSSEPISWIEVRKFVYQLELAHFERLENRLEYACYRLANRFLIVNRDAENVSLILYTSAQAYTCCINIRSRSVPDFQKSSFLIIKRHIESHLSFQTLLEANQQVILLSLQGNSVSQRRSQLACVNNDIINTYSSLRKINGHNNRIIDKYLGCYIRYCWMNVPGNLSIFINERPISLISMKKTLNQAVSNEPDRVIMDEPINNFIFFTPESKQCRILYYKNNILRGSYKGEHCEKYTGIVEIFQQSFYPDQLDQGINKSLSEHYSKEGLKRGPAVKVESLVYQCKEKQDSTMEIEKV